MSTLLIADDERPVRILVRMTLQNDAYEILEAEDGEEALRLAREHRPDVVLLDVMMPGLSGYDVCRALKEDPRTAGIIVIILSANAQETDLSDREMAGADDYLTKPFSPLTLMRTVDEALSSGRP